MSKPPIIFQIPDSTFLKKKILLKEKLISALPA